MKIIAKSAPYEDNINAKINLGTNDIEIQLLPDFNENCDINVFFNNIVNTSCNVEIVHMPLEKGIDLNFELFTHPKYKSIFLKCCSLSEKLAKHFNHRVIIVVHLGLSLETFQFMPGLFSDLLSMLKEIIHNFKNIDIAFENVVPLTFDKNNVLVTKNGFLFDNVDLANWLNDELKTNIFGTVLDTCHVFQYEKHMINALGNEIHIFSMEDFFMKNKGTIKLIHLCDLKNNGLNKGEHGILFEDKNKLKDILDLYYKYNYSCLVTLEVLEEDYYVCNNFKNQKIMLENILDDLNKQKA